MLKARYGIVGIGNQGGNYARKLNGGADKNAVLTAVCDTCEQRREWARQTLTGVQVFENYQNMYDSGMVDAALICTPPDNHVRPAADAFKSGLSVLVDKPPAAELEDFKALCNAAKNYPDKAFSVMLNQRTDSLYAKAKQLIEQGELGELKRVVWQATDWYRPQKYYQDNWRGKSKGGVLLLQASHQLDLAAWLFGLPQRVTAFLKTEGRQMQGENDACVFLEYGGGATGVFIASSHETPGTNRLEATGTRGKIVIEGRKLRFWQTDVKEPAFAAHNEHFIARPGTVKKTFKKRLFEAVLQKRTCGQHLKIITNFSRVVMGKNEKLLVCGHDALAGMQLLDMIYNSRQ